jgi:catechol 2,3-dioxygenase-like lactoylglutathione lyase family enzyme
MHLEHVNLTVADLDRSIDFYCRLLGFRVRWRRDGGEDRPAAHIGDDRVYLALFEAPPSRNGRAPLDYDAVGLNHFGFVVDDLAAMKQRLAELGVAPKSEADYEPGRRLYFLDPDGIEVELVEYDPE